MTKEEVKQGDIIMSDDDTAIMVHHIGSIGQVHYIACTDMERGRMGKEPFVAHYGYIEDCRPANDAEKQMLYNFMSYQEEDQWLRYF